MRRREFIQVAAAAAAAARLVEASSLGRSKGAAGFDRYGGWTGRSFEPTGFFRVEKDDRWWLVTPDGNAFLSFGINHFYTDLWNQDYNREAWRKRLGVADESAPEYYPALRRWFLETCEEYGFNTVGVHTSMRVVNTPRPTLPYVQALPFVDIPHWRPEIPDENFVDVFAPEYVARCDAMVEERAAPIRKDPFLLGYYMTDCPLFTEEDCRERPDTIGGARRGSRIGWPRRLRNLPGTAPGKRVYVETVHELYEGQIASFNRTYGTDFGSFDALVAAANWRPETELSNPQETRDNLVFLRKAVEQYYRVGHDAIRRVDPDHMFLGDKINANTDTMDTVFDVTSRYTDLVFYQMYARYEVQKPGLDRWSKRVDKAFINGDSAFTMVTDTMPRPYGPIADDLEQRAAWTEEFFRSAFARPEFVGWHYCGLIDSPILVPRKWDRQHSGIIDGFGEPYPEIRKVLQSCTSEMYSIARGREGDG